MDEEPTKPESWWQTLPGILTAVTGILTAATGLIIALTQTGIFSNGEQQVAPTAVTTTANSVTEATETSELSEIADPTVETPETSSPTTEDTADMGELEQQLLTANIELGPTPKDAEKTREYLADNNAAYRLLADSCVQIMDNLRLKKVGYLDVIDKHYTALVGEDHYLSADGQLNMEKVKEAMVDADNEIHGTNATTFEQIVESDE